MTISAPQNFLITGASSGLGLALGRAALARGHRVFGTVRDRAARATFEALAPERAIAPILDITDAKGVQRVVTELENEFGSIDVLVNNAGYGHEGIIEESDLDELQRQFEVNVFGTISVIKSVLPYMRRRRKGRIITITSMGGLVAFPGVGYYCASKFALEGFSETLRQEVAAFGIAVTAVEPGSFRTNWAGGSMRRSARSITDYDALFEPLRKRRQEYSGRQLGDPAKAAAAILKLVESSAPPAHLILGPDALSFVQKKLDELRREMADWESTTTSTNVDTP
ncbi:oxidoreductase [Pendulispora brunnea]|uniref:Oxidoreductase n=1 Tax=Pendulispora brunnea TaxID=2905690 RepID=A0ABZ2K6M0_9BACT